MTHLIEDLRWRGFLQTATPGLDEHLARGPVTVYCGFDPTAPSLQLGNVVPLLLLAHLQRDGHRPVVLMGGGTGLIGDPSGQRAERPLLSKEQLRANLERMRSQMGRFLDFADGHALMRDNAEWLVAAQLVDFLRDVGKHFTVNVMLQKESVRARLEGGISFTEFSYMLLQAYDFLQLYRREGCTLQVGGSDQWGNITAGVDLIRRVEGAEAHGLVHPLLTTAAGAKFGKSEAGAIYLDPALTSPYKFYQFWVNTDDRDVEPYLKLFTRRPRIGPEGIEAILAAHQRDPSKRAAQHQLATDVTRLVHGEPALEAVTMATALLFSEWDPRLAKASAFDALQSEIPTTTVSSGETLALVDALVRSSLVKSKGEGRRQIEQGGIYVNQERAQDATRTLGESDWLAGGNMLLRKGKKDYALLRLKPQ